MRGWTEEHELQFALVLLPTDCYVTPVTYVLQSHCRATKVRKIMFGHYINPKDSSDI